MRDVSLVPSFIQQMDCFKSALFHRVKSRDEPPWVCSYLSYVNKSPTKCRYIQAKFDS